jgi:methylthioribulose-1-phosphate dehydratase
MQRGLDRLWDGMAKGGHAALPGYLIRGHGSYVWGADMPATLARLEALEFMLACEMQDRRMR